MHKLRSFPEFCCFDAVHQYYSSANPTNKAVISLLDVEPKSDAERDCLRFLQRYIRGLDKSQLIKFLRFTTGSDIIAVDKITVDFIKSDGMQRRPIARTCGPILELCYTNARRIPKCINWNVFIWMALSLCLTKGLMNLTN